MLINPTPFPVEWNYDRGIQIVIPPDGHAELDSEMTAQFRPDAPNTEKIREEMIQHGIYLMDLARPIDYQSMEALEALVELRSNRLRQGISDLRGAGASLGTFTEDAFEEQKVQCGYDKLERELAILKRRLKLYKGRLAKEDRTNPLEKQLDPRRTLLFTDPPKEFDSELAMEIYLDEHPEEKKKQAEWIAKLQAASKKPTKAAASAS